MDDSVNPILCIEDAEKILREMEGEVRATRRNGNPLFKKPEDLVFRMYENDRLKALRNLYNYLKHRGSFLYCEKEGREKVMSVCIDGVEMPTSPADVQKPLVLDEAMSDLCALDSELLGYLEKLWYLLDESVDPSPMVL